MHLRDEVTKPVIPQHGNPRGSAAMLV